jgi:hypothetical protein
MEENEGGTKERRNGGTDRPKKEISSNTNGRGCPVAGCRVRRTAIARSRPVAAVAKCSKAVLWNGRACRPSCCPPNDASTEKCAPSTDTSIAVRLGAALRADNTNPISTADSTVDCNSRNVMETGDFHPNELSPGAASVDTTSPSLSSLPVAT